MPELEPAWRSLFPDKDFSFRFGFRACSPQEFFEPGPLGSKLLTECARWLDEMPERYCRVRPEGGEILRETVKHAREWAGLRDVPPLELDDPGLAEWLWRRLEPDFVLLRRHGDQFDLVGGCVCFPSSWRLTDKVGLPLAEVHAPVPGLNEEYGDTIARYLSRLRPGMAMTRANWGLSRSPELNHHPDLGLPGLGPEVNVSEVFLRIEWQALVALAGTGGIVFGIRLEIVPLAEVIREPETAAGLRRALRTMPDSVALYKGLEPARDGLIRLLDQAG